MLIHSITVIYEIINAIYVKEHSALWLILIGQTYFAVNVIVILLNYNLEYENLSWQSIVWV